MLLLFLLVWGMAIGWIAWLVVRGVWTRLRHRSAVDAS